MRLIIDISNDEATVIKGEELSPCVLRTSGEELRPCIVRDKSARFHRWVERATPVEPSALLGGHNGGVSKWVVGIIEFEDGTVAEVLPQYIRFINSEREDAEE